MRLTFETGDLAGVLRGLALRIVEIRRHRHDGLGDGFAEIVFRGLFHLHQHARRNLGRRHFLAVRLDPGVAVVGLDDLVRHHVDVTLDDVVLEATPNQALDREQGVGRIGHGLALGRLPDQHLVVLAERNDRRRRAIALAVFDHLGRAAFHDRNAGVGGTQVDTDYFTHADTPKILCFPKLVVNWGRALLFQALPRHCYSQPPPSPGGASAATITRAGRSRRPFSA